MNGRAVRFMLLCILGGVAIMAATAALLRTSYPRTTTFDTAAGIVEESPPVVLRVCGPSIAATEGSRPSCEETVESVRIKMTGGRSVHGKAVRVRLRSASGQRIDRDIVIDGVATFDRPPAVVAVETELDGIALCAIPSVLNFRGDADEYEIYVGVYASLEVEFAGPDAYVLERSATFRLRERVSGVSTPNTRVQRPGVSSPIIHAVPAAEYDLVVDFDDRSGTRASWRAERAIALEPGRHHRLLISPPLDVGRTAALSLDLTNDRTSIPGDAVDSVRAIVGGRIFDMPRSESGRFECRIFGLGREWTPDRILPASIEVFGRLIQDYRFDIPIADLAQGTYSSVQACDLFTDGFSVRVLRSGGRAVVANHDLRIALRRSTDKSGNDLVTVRTDADGIARIDGVRFPCVFFCVPSRGGERWLPDASAPVRVDEDSVCDIEIESQVECRIRIAREFAPEIMADVDSGSIWFDALPLDRIAEPKRIDIASVRKELVLDRKDVLLPDGSIVASIGALPKGRYLVTLFSSSLGVVNHLIDIVSDSGIVDVDMTFAARRPDLSSRLPRKMSDDALVALDGYVPSHLAVVIASDIPHEIEEDQRARCIATHVDPAVLGDIRSRDFEDRPITLVNRIGEVSRLGFSQARGVMEKSDKASIGDGKISGVVLDAAGRPIAGAMVNVTSLIGGEDFVIAPTPITAEMRELQTGADGTFQISNVTSALYVLSVSSLVLDPDRRERSFHFNPASLRIIRVNSEKESIVDIRLPDDAYPCRCGVHHLTQNHVDDRH